MKRSFTLFTLLIAASAYASDPIGNDSTATDSVKPYRVDITPFAHTYSTLPLPDPNDTKRPKSISVKYDQ